MLTPISGAKVTGQQNPGERLDNLKWRFDDPERGEVIPLQRGNFVVSGKWRRNGLDCDRVRGTGPKGMSGAGAGEGRKSSNRGTKGQ
jgi:hypothetical protein